MANGNSKILTAEQEKQLRQPIDDYVGNIQKQINSLRADGTDKVLSLQNHMDGLREIVRLQREKEKIGLHKIKQS